MNMITVKTAELIGPALDWAVGNACAADVRELYKDGNVWLVAPFGKPWNPSAYWEHGGPLIEKYHATIWYKDETHRGEGYWHACIDHGRHEYTEDGDSLLIAACRAIVAAKLGDVVQVPVALVNP